MDPQELLKSLSDELRQLVRTETIIGEQITIGENTIIPVCRVMVGFGGGTGEGEQSGEGSKKNVGGGGGGGGGARVEPAAFIVIKGEDVSILAAPGKKGALAGVFEAIPDLVEKITEAKKGAANEGESEEE